VNPTTPWYVVTANGTPYTIYTRQADRSLGGWADVAINALAMVAALLCCIEAGLQV
jgi:hypothetical protein